MKVHISDFMSAFALEFQKQRDRQKKFHFAMRLHPKFEALRGSILHRHSLLGLTESVVEFTSEETRLRMLSSSLALVQSASSPTAIAAPHHASTSCGPLNHGSPSHGPVN